MNTELRDDVELQNYILSLTEQDAINAQQNARIEATRGGVKFTDTGAFQAYEHARTLMGEMLWIGPAVESGDPTSTYVERRKAGQPFLSLENLKFALWLSKASRIGGAYSS